jgi:amidase
MRRILSILIVIGVAAGARIDAQRTARFTPAATPAFDVMEKTIVELQEAMQQGATTSQELVEIYLARIEAYDRRGPRINSIVSLNPRAREEATALDRERAERGARGPLHGIPVVVKDNFDMAGLPTTAGTLAFAALYPKDDAFQVKKLREAGAVILGKTNLHELASGITTIGSGSGQTLNPYDLARNPGGSSGGTGAAVAANFAVAGLGSDTCGSIRIPASHNALVGMRGTYGLSSRDGVVPLSHTQDVAGPLARTVTDLAIMLDATVGPDAADDSTKAGEGRRPKSYREALTADALKGARIGILTPLFGTAPEDNEGGAVVRRALEDMKKLGAEVIDAPVPGLDDLLRNSGVIDMEFKFDLADYLAAVPNAPVKSLADILERGLYHDAIESSLRRRNAAKGRDSDQYRRAMIKRDAARNAVIATIQEHRLDALVYPTMRRKPALIAESQGGSTCQLSAATGLPALSVPAGFTTDGLPIGLELLGNAFTEPRLLALGYAWEKHDPIRRPPFSAPALAGRAAPPPLSFVTTTAASANISTSLTVKFTFDQTTGDLSYIAAVKGAAPDEVLSAWIHQGAAGESGGAVFQLLRRGDIESAGAIRLRPNDHSRLREGRFYVALYTRQNATGALRGQMTVK